VVTGRVVTRESSVQEPVLEASASSSKFTSRRASETSI
jgi:hypothetical protein